MKDILSTVKWLVRIVKKQVITIKKLVIDVDNIPDIDGLTNNSKTFIGLGAGESVMAGLGQGYCGNEAVWIGFNAGKEATASQNHNNVFIGMNAGLHGAESRNVFIGSGAGMNEATPNAGASNVLVGVGIGGKRAGSENTVIGTNFLSGQHLGEREIFIGSHAMGGDATKSNHGRDNTVIGTFGAWRDVTEDVNNTLIIGTGYIGKPQTTGEFRMGVSKPLFTGVPVDLFMFGNQEKGKRALRINGKFSIGSDNSTLEGEDLYSLPTTAGVAGQGLKLGVDGRTLEWYTI